MTDPARVEAPPKPEVTSVAKLSIPELLARYNRGVENFDRRVFELNDAQLDTAFRPEAGVGNWPIRVLLGHIADVELLYSSRMRRLVGEDHPVLSLWDEQAFIDAGMYRGPIADVPGVLRSPPPIGGFVAVTHTVRRWTAEWLAALEEQAWERTGLHPVNGEQSVRDIAVQATWHLEHHAWYLNRKVERFLGPPPPPPSPVASSAANP